MNVVIGYAREVNKCLLKSAHKSPISFDDIHPISFDDIHLKVYLFKSGEPLIMCSEYSGIFQDWKILF